MDISICPISICHNRIQSEKNFIFIYIYMGHIYMSYNESHKHDKDLTCHCRSEAGRGLCRRAS